MSLPERLFWFLAGVSAIFAVLVALLMMAPKSELDDDGMED
jgi:hypothetical protein